MKYPIEQTTKLRTLCTGFWLPAILITTIMAGCSRFNQGDLNRIIPVPTKESDWKELDLSKQSSPEKNSNLQQTELVQRERHKLTEKIQRNLPQFKLPAVEVAANPLRPISESTVDDASQPGLIRLKSEWPETSPALSDSNTSGTTEHAASGAVADNANGPDAVSDQTTSRRPLPSTLDGTAADDTDRPTEPDNAPDVDTPWPSETTGVGLKPIDCCDGDGVPESTSSPSSESVNIATQKQPETGTENGAESETTPINHSAETPDSDSATTEVFQTNATSPANPADAATENARPVDVDAEMSASFDPAAISSNASIEPLTTIVPPSENRSPATGGDFRPVGSAILDSQVERTASASPATNASNIPVLTETPSTVAPAAAAVSSASVTASETVALSPWRTRLASTIESIEDQIIELGMDDYRRPALQRSLAMLMVLETQLDDEAMALQSPERRAYWDHQLSAILNVLNSPRSSAPDNGALFTAIEHLEDATAELKNLAALRITTTEFCSEVSGFGQYRTMKRIRSGRPTLVYCEIENFKSLPGTQSSQPGFLTRLKCRATILTADGRTAQEVEYPVIEDIARNRRRDFYLHLPLVLDELPIGRYRLVVTIEDLGSGKSATLSPPRDFEIE